MLALPRVATAARKRPNILFVIMDDVGIDQMRVFGYDQDNQPQTNFWAAFSRSLADADGDAFGVGAGWEANAKPSVAKRVKTIAA